MKRQRSFVVILSLLFAVNFSFSNEGVTLTEVDNICIEVASDVQNDIYTEIMSDLQENVSANSLVPAEDEFVCLEACKVAFDLCILNGSNEAACLTAYIACQIGCLLIS